ncbi:hypothetical protein BDN72DRAFT_912763 [Pluteus cervinus]|uniref:Uncharacterized protein n=1 Tax=Pluteus cervinus TaxID=181527 RepID=A0ACD2ZZ62_9AGAR|nr:hypothetical protein BDN72DRAFT_912763 [Pluteus cervinus]
MQWNELVQSLSNSEKLLGRSNTPGSQSQARGTEGKPKDQGTDNTRVVGQDLGSKAQIKTGESDLTMRYIYTSENLNIEYKNAAPVYTAVPPMLAYGELLLSLERQQHPLGSIGDMQGALGPMASLHKMHQAFLRIHEDQLVRGVQKHVHECVDLLDERITSMVRSSREREFMVDQDIRVLSRVQGILACRCRLRRYRPYFHKVCVGDEDREEVFGESDEEESGSDMELESNGEVVNVKECGWDMKMSVEIRKSEVIRNFWWELLVFHKLQDSTSRESDNEVFIIKPWFLFNDFNLTNDIMWGRAIRIGAMEILYDLFGVLHISFRFPSAFFSRVPFPLNQDWWWRGRMLLGWELTFAVSCEEELVEDGMYCWPSGGKLQFIS